MSTQHWCITNLTPFCEAANGKKLFDISRGALIETTGQSTVVLMRSANGTMVNTPWMQVLYKTIKGTQTGWVRSELFDEYVEDFPNPEVDIPQLPGDPTDPFPYATSDPNDAAQYMVLGKDKFGNELTKVNMCGELCVSFMAELGIKEFIKKWTSHPGNLFQWARGATSDKTTGLSTIMNMLEALGMTAANGSVIDFTASLTGPIFQDKSWSPGKFQKFLQTHTLLANVVVERYTGRLIPNDATKQNWINHWVVVDKVTPNATDGGRVQIYNPYQNRRQEYSYEQFIRSFGGATFTGAWVKRKQDQPSTGGSGNAFKKWNTTVNDFADAPGGRKIMAIDPGIVLSVTEKSETVNGIRWRQVKYKNQLGWARESALDDYADRFPDNEVLIPNPTPEEDDAAQYMFLLGENGIKNNMCGQLCAAFIIKVDIETFVDDWKVKANNFYKLSIAGNTDNPTGIDSIASMFKVAPYNAQPGDLTAFDIPMKDPITNRVIVSPGRIANMLKTHYLVAGVRIKSTDKLTGKLSGQGTGHWVVLDKIAPNGRLGGNGGWVEIYNPFPNKRQEYSYEEFIRSFAGYLGLWVKRK
ncbi:MAG: hypothetical protein JNM55_10930 [Anaerolineales bacterium]|nr:hypothetical protein [Anaerolineales bacterium]